MVQYSRFVECGWFLSLRPLHDKVGELDRRPRGIIDVESIEFEGTFHEENLTICHCLGVGGKKIFCHVRNYRIHFTCLARCPQEYTVLIELLAPECYM